MNNSNSAYLSLSNQIDRFIDKYYRLRAFKGALMVGVLFIVVFVSVIFLEQAFHFSSIGRSILFFGSLLIIILALLSQVIIPIAQSLRVYKRINYKKAASLISSVVPGLNDELVNTIELESSKNKDNNELLDASITQKAVKVLKFDLLEGFSVKQYKRYLIGFLMVFCVSLIGSFTFSDFIISPIKRVVQFQNNFLPENPYKFEINSGLPLIILENENLGLKIKTIGKTDPQNLTIYSNGARYFPIKTSNFSFEYQFNNIRKNFTFSLKDGLGDTANFNVTVLPKAKILEEKKIINYPEYTSLKNDTFSDLSNVIVPEGSTISWEIKLKNTSELSAGFIDTLFLFNDSSNICRFYYAPRESQSYQLRVKNNLSEYVDTIGYSIKIEKDLYPTIYFEEFLDSSIIGNKYFLGTIGDDYGFSRLTFNYSSSVDDSLRSVPISFEGKNESSFNFDMNFGSLNLSEGEKITYYFSIWDNDKINGPKETKSFIKTLSVPNKSEIKKEKKRNSVEKEMALSNLQKNVASFNEDLKKIKADLLNKKKMDWNDKNNIQNFLKKQTAIQLELDQLQKKMKKSLSFELDEKSEEIIKKQDLLNKMMDELMSDEMKKLYDELNNLVEQMNKDKVLDKMDGIDLSQENLIKELDRTIEHFKRLEIEQKAKDLGKELEELAKKQDTLSKQSKEKEISSFEKTKNQEKIKSDFYDIKKELFELQKKNEELASPKELDTESEENEIQKNIERALDEISKNKNKKASESQSNASEQMKKLSKKLNILSKESQSQQEEDLASLRILLEQLLTFSIDQEDLLSSLKKTKSQDPKYVAIGKNQRKLKDELKTIDDSLTALAKRQIMISNKINSEVQQIKRALNQSIKNLTERKNRTAQLNQQTVMMHTNELGLLLSEVMEQMQNQMPGNGQCNKPGGKNKKPGNSLPKSSDQLKKQIEAMKKFMKEQKNGNKPGGKRGSFEQLGRMAAEQAAIKKQLMEMAQEMNKDGSGKGNGIKKIIKDLEDVEEQIINNELDLSSVMRQEEIKIKLLELEKATKQQEEDKKREAKESKEDYKRNNLELYNEYLKIKNGQIELLKSIPPNLKPYYKNKVNEYFKNVEKDYD